MRIGTSLVEPRSGSLDELTWVVDVYVLTFASLLLLGGSLATALGSRRLYLAGMALFLVASLACAVAPSAALLIGGFACGSGSLVGLDARYVVGIVYVP